VREASHREQRSRIKIIPSRLTKKKSRQAGEVDAGLAFKLPSAVSWRKLGGRNDLERRREKPFFSHDG